VTLDAKAASVVADAARKLKNRFSIGKPPGALPVKDERGECIGVTPAAKRAKLADENVAPGAKSSVPTRTPPAGDFRGARIASLEDSAERLTTNANAAAAAAHENTRSMDTQPARLEGTRSPTAAEAARSRARTNNAYDGNSGDADENKRAESSSSADVAAAATAALAKKPQAVDVHWFPASSKDVSGPPGFKLDRAIELVLKETGVPELYSHQKAACDAVLRDKKSVVIATPTASGKSLGYVVPLLTRLSERRTSRAVLLFPLKALANDQLEKLRRFTETAGRLADSGAFDDAKNAALLRRLRAIASVSAAVCDGDTSSSARAAIKSEKTQIVLTNPDALHHFVLPGFVTKKFTKTFFNNLEFVVVDEAHAHTGVEGSHVANVLRRLLRVCRECDNESVRFICTSATIANPAEHVRALTTVTPAAVTESGAPRARRAAILWRPPALPRKKKLSAEPGNGSHQRDDKDKDKDKDTDALSDDTDTFLAEADADAPAARRSAVAEAADVVADLVRRRASCLCFVTARSLVESVCRDVRQRLMRSGDQALALRVDSYRGGYGAEERRSIERRLKNGELFALITTSALEMGIDVGALDATVHVGVPQTASSMWQQAGRAGRRDASSVAVVIARESPLDAYFLDRPKELWHRAPGARGGGPGERRHIRAAPAVRGARSARRRQARRIRLRRRERRTPRARDRGCGVHNEGGAVPDAVPARAEARNGAHPGEPARRRAERRVERRDAFTRSERRENKVEVPRRVPPARRREPSRVPKRRTRLDRPGRHQRFVHQRRRGGGGARFAERRRATRLPGVFVFVSKRYVSRRRSPGGKRPRRAVRPHKPRGGAPALHLAVDTRRDRTAFRAGSREGRTRTRDARRARRDARRRRASRRDGTRRRLRLVRPRRTFKPRGAPAHDVPRPFVFRRVRHGRRLVASSARRAFADPA
jgi:superfamily II DNA/RNA helicase